MTEVIRIGTRGSALARWQTDYIAQRLRDAWDDIEIEIEVITTRGDVVLDKSLPAIGGKGLFTEELEHALRTGAIDLAVHSLKDLPTEPTPGLPIGAIPERANPADVLISRGGQPLNELPNGATVGTSSRRRAAQLLHLRPDLNMLDIRGNVDTRIAKALDPDGLYDAIVLAHAGINRIGRSEVITETLPLDVMLPAPGQGALAVQCREDWVLRPRLEPLHDPATMLTVTAERVFLQQLGGGCSLPVAAHAQIDGSALHLHGRITATDGETQIDVTGTTSLTNDSAADVNAAAALARSLVEQARQHGAQHLLEHLI